MTLSTVAEMLTLIDEARSDGDQERSKDTAARELLGRLLESTIDRGDGRKRIIVDEGSELWAAIDKLLDRKWEQLVLPHPDPVKIVYVERPRSYGSGWRTA